MPRRVDGPAKPVLPPLTKKRPKKREPRRQVDFNGNVSYEKEKDFTGACIELAQTLGYRVCHFRPAMNRDGSWVTALQGHIGLPDLVIAGRGRMIFAELKMPGKPLDPAQELWRAELEGGPAEWYLWYPYDWDAIVECLNRW